MLCELGLDLSALCDEIGWSGIPPNRFSADYADGTDDNPSRCRAFAKTSSAGTHTDTSWRDEVRKERSRCGLNQAQAEGGVAGGRIFEAGIGGQFLRLPRSDGELVAGFVLGMLGVTLDPLKRDRVARQQCA